jgi:nitroimidazol reductase NimA-like FMN-containing flavoprotein (pyridoxamine 5'-phosphate oxidase superfamily)
MTSQAPPPAQSGPASMTREEMETFLSEVRNVMVATIRRDGRPQMTPNWFIWEGCRFYI